MLIGNGQSEESILVGTFVSKYDPDPAGDKSDKVSFWVDGVDIWDENIDPEVETELYGRHVDDWWNDAYGEIWVSTVEQKRFIEEGQ